MYLGVASRPDVFTLTLTLPWTIIHVSALLPDNRPRNVFQEVLFREDGPQTAAGDITVAEVGERRSRDARIFLDLDWSPLSLAEP
ncbi:unnamed protein product [Nezara viridula]|uniref:Uncharacterized protein n=1 Tax=Nezara viridula TaxID=85310 RepID=A0A9P0E3Z5_NEZVI|nr:unnamed protein product [Nezara viridula]